MNKSRWNKMTKEQKAAYYAARKARKAAKAKAVANAVKNAPKGADHVATPHGAVPVPEKKATAKKVPAKKCAKKCGTACPCKKDPNGSPEERLLAAIFGKDAAKLMTGSVSVSERSAAFALDRAHRENCAVDHACRVIGNALLDLVRVFRPSIAKLVIEHKDPATAKNTPKAK